jgi:hypothetical protein
MYVGAGFSRPDPRSIVRLKYLAITNEAPKPFVWTKTADEILAEVAGFCQRT